VAPVRLHVDVVGIGQPRRALVIHGLGSDCRTMWQVTAHLVGQGHEVHAPDLRGHGRSPAAGTYALLEMVEDVALLGHGWDVVVGHSLGGAVLAELLTRPGYAVRGVLLDPVLTILGDAARVIAETIVAEVGGDLTLAALQEASPKWHAEDHWRKVAASATVSPLVVTSCIHDSAPWDLSDRPARWTCPVHIVAADPVEGAMFVASSIPGIDDLEDVRVTVIEGAGHSVHRDDPAAVLATL